MNVELIIGGKSADNVPFLKLFLIDYKREFSIETVNAACQKCIVAYHREFIKKYSTMENTSNYQLHKKEKGYNLNLVARFLSQMKTLQTATLKS